MSITINPEFIGAIIDACEDTVTGGSGYAVVKDLPEVVFEGGRYDRLAAAVRKTLEAHGLGPAGRMAFGKTSALAAAHAVVASGEIAVAAMDILDGISPIRGGTEDVKDLLLDLSTAVTETVMSWG